MFTRKIRILLYVCLSALSALLATFGIVVATSAQSDERLQTQTGEIAHAVTDDTDYYAIAAQSDFDGMKTDGICKECGRICHLVENRTQFASIFKFSQDQNTNFCYRLTFTGEVDLGKWAATSQGKVKFVSAGVFQGHIDFNNIAIYMDYGDMKGIFPYMDGARIENLTYYQLSTGYAFGISLMNITFINVHFDVTVSGNGTTASGDGAIMAAICNRMSGTMLDCSSYVRTPKNADGTYQSFIRGYFGGWCYYFGVAGGTESYLENCSGSFEGNFNGIISGITANSYNMIYKNCTGELVDAANASYAVSNFWGAMTGILRSGPSSGRTMYDHCNFIFGEFSSNANLTGGISGDNNTTQKITYSGCRVIGRKATLKGAPSSLMASSDHPTLNHVEILDCNVTVLDTLSVAAYDSILFSSTRGECILYVKDTAIKVKNFSCGSNSGIFCFSKSGIKITQTVDNCEVYIETMQGNAETTTQLITGAGNLAAGSVSVVTNSKIFIQNCSGMQADGDLFAGDAASEHLVQITGCTYIGHAKEEAVGINTQYTTSDGRKCNISDNTRLTTAAEKDSAQKEISDQIEKGQGEFDGSAEIEQPISLTGKIENEALQLTAKFSSDYAGYTVRALYISVWGYDSNRYTQLIHKGKIIGYLGAGLGFGSSVGCDADLTFSYAALPATLSSVNLRFILINARGDVRYVTSSASGWSAETSAEYA